MTDITFHFGAPDKLGYACRLLRKAVASGSRVLVVVDAEALARLDDDVWALAPTDFVVHCTTQADLSVQQRSPVMLVTHTDQAPQHQQVLVNLTQSVPDAFEKFERVIEVVSTDDSDRELARRRWRRYTELGYPITQHNLTLRGAN